MSHMRATLVRWEGVWLAVCVLGWLLLSLGGGKSEAECRADDDFLCLSTSDLLLFGAIYGLLVWIAGGVVIALVWAFAGWLRGRSGRVDDDWTDDVF